MYVYGACCFMSVVVTVFSVCIVTCGDVGACAWEV